jgi:ATP-dependent Clp protease ATP-binding subunit ClpX
MLKESRIRDHMKQCTQTRKYLQTVKSNQTIKVEGMEIESEILFDSDMLLPFVVFLANKIYQRKLSRQVNPFIYIADNQSMCSLKVKSTNSKPLSKTFKQALCHASDHLLGSMWITDIVRKSRRTIEKLQGEVDSETLESILHDVMENLPNMSSIERINKKIQKSITHKEKGLKKAIEKFDELEKEQDRPSDIIKTVESSVTGQQDAIRRLAMIGHTHKHFHKIYNARHKSTPLIIGESGCGKTYTIRTLAKSLDLPFLSLSAQSLTTTGYSGANIEDVLYKFFKKHDDKCTEEDRIKYLKCIIFVDEIDKIKREHCGKDISGEGAQNALLSFMEGENIVDPDGQQSCSTEIYNTSLCLFVCAGAFEGIDRIVCDRQNTLTHHNKSENIYRDVTPNDLLQYGFKKELVGRLSAPMPFVPLTETDLIDLLKNKENTILKYYFNLFCNASVWVEFSDDFIEYVAKQAIKKNIGARGLKNYLELALSELMFTFTEFPCPKQWIIDVNDASKATLEETFGIPKVMLTKEYLIQPDRYFTQPLKVISTT